VLCELAKQFLALAQKQGGAAPIMIGHRLVGCSLLFTGELVAGLADLDRAIALYDPLQHRTLTARFGHDVGVVTRVWRAFALWLVGRPDTARTNADRALKDAREIGHSATLLYALTLTGVTQISLGDFLKSQTQQAEAIALANEKSSAFWRSIALMFQGFGLVGTGDAGSAVRSHGANFSQYRSTGSTMLAPAMLSCLAEAHAQLGRYSDASHCIDEAAKTAEATGEQWFSAEIHRTAGEIALLSPVRDAAKAQAYFESALEIARAQQARSWELRAASSLARLWRDQGKRVEAHDLLAPIYGWFTEGFDTRDLKGAKALLDELREGTSREATTAAASVSDGRPAPN
jgi:predicted ATPase